MHKHRLRYQPTCFFAALLLSSISSIRTNHASAQQSEGFYRDLVNPDEVKSGISVLDSFTDIISPAIAIVRCDMLIEHGRTEIEMVFAGICRIANKKRIKVCGDTAVDWFAPSPWEAPAMPQDRSGLVTFMNRDCPGGG